MTIVVKKQLIIVYKQMKQKAKLMIAHVLKYLNDRPFQELFIT